MGVMSSDGLKKGRQCEGVVRETEHNNNNKRDRGATVLWGL